MVPNEDRYAERAGIDYLGTALNHHSIFLLLVEVTVTVTLSLEDR